MSRDYNGRFNAAVRIMRRFLADHSALVAPEYQRAAWVSTYVNHSIRLATAGHKGEALPFMMRALVRQPLKARTWLEFVRLPWR